MQGIDLVGEPELGPADLAGVLAPAVQEVLHRVTSIRVAVWSRPSFDQSSMFALANLESSSRTCCAVITPPCAEASAISATRAEVDELKLPITVCHLPPAPASGTRSSTASFHSTPSTGAAIRCKNYRTIVQLIAATTTDTGAQRK